MIKQHRLKCIGCNTVIEHVYSAAICVQCGMMMYDEKTKKRVASAAAADEAHVDDNDKEVF